jgi:hypothetical protein
MAKYIWWEQGNGVESLIAIEYTKHHKEWRNNKKIQIPTIKLENGVKLVVYY